MFMHLLSDWYIMEGECKKMTAAGGSLLKKIIYCDSRNHGPNIADLEFELEA